MVLVFLELREKSRQIVLPPVLERAMGDYGCRKELRSKMWISFFLCGKMKKQAL